MRPSDLSLLPPPSVLLSRAFWFTRDHPDAVVGLGLLGTAPGAALLLLLLREAHEFWLVAGQASALAPLCFGVAAVYFLRFPFRLALARFMATATRGERASVLEASAFAFAHLPTSLFYGSVSTLGWLLGAVALFPLIFAFQATLAFHRFAATDLSAWAALKDAGRLPVIAIGIRLLAGAAALAFAVFLVLWTTPGAVLGLAEWLLRADVAALRAVVGASSAAWAAAALIVALTGVELLWTVAFGLLSAEWQKLSGGSDLAAMLDLLERRGASGDEAFD